MQASTFLKSNEDPSKEGSFELERPDESRMTSDSNLKKEFLAKKPKNSSQYYLQLQLRIYRATLIVSAIAVSIAAIFFGYLTSLSLLIGALSGVFYLRLLARSVGRLGKSSQALGKFQLLVPVFLVLIVTKLPQLELFPAVIGFLLYKPSLVIQFLLESHSSEIVQSD